MKQSATPLNILGETIKPGESREAAFNIAKLHTQTPVDVPVIIERSKKTWPHYFIYCRYSR